MDRSGYRPTDAPTRVIGHPVALSIILLNFLLVGHPFLRARSGPLEASILRATYAAGGWISLDVGARYIHAFRACLLTRHFSCW